MLLGRKRSFINYCDDRKEQHLEVINRNSKDYSVVVSYNPGNLKAGYYALEVRNPGDNRDSIELLVLDDAVSQIQPEKGFEVDEHYKVNTFANKNSGVYEFSIKGKGFNSSTRFYLEPAQGTFPYPFESAIPRKSVDVNVTGIYKQGGGNAQLTMSCALEDLRTGYYNLIANNWDGSSVKFICLVKKPFDHDYTKKIKTLKTKFNKKTEYVDVTLADDKFDSSKTYTLVSEYDSGTDTNKRVLLDLSGSGKKLTGSVFPDQLTIAKYALLVEDEFSYDVVYCDIDSSLRISENKMSDSVISKTFLRPVNAELAVTLDADDVSSVVYYDNLVKMKKYIPPLFSNIRFDVSILPDQSTVFDGEIDLFHYGVFTFSGGYEYVMMENDYEQSVLGTIRFSVLNNYFQPYIGFGLGQQLVIPDAGIKKTKDVVGMLTDKQQTYAFAHVGLSLLTVFDIRYNLFLRDMFTSPYFTESISIGSSFPIRPYKFKRKVLTQTAQISKPGILEGSTVVETERKIPIDKIEILRSSSVNGFAGNNTVKQFVIDTSVETIEENAFADCKNLETVVFKSALKDDVLLTIKTNAFAGNSKIESIRLPSRTRVVQSGAFAGWTSGQLIILEWDPDDETERDLSGLRDCPATVLYWNEEVFHGGFKTPFDDARNWCQINKLKMKNVSVHKDDKYILGLTFNGYAPAWYMTELDTWINQESPQQIIDYIKSGDRIRFNIQGDGNKYYFILTTPDGGYFYYKFKTKADKIVEVNIPYKNLKRFNFSSQKKLDVDNIKMCCVIPECKGEWFDATLFDFEVISHE